MADSIDIPIVATGGAAGAAEVNKATAAVGAFSRASASAAQSSTAFAQSTQRLSAGLGAFGGALGQIDPVLGQFGASVSRAGGAIGAMTSLIGGGPGVLFGGAVAVIGMLAAAWRSSVQDAEAATRATEAKTRALEGQARAADKARQSLQDLITLEQQASATRALNARVGRGAGSLEEQRGNLADVQRRIAEATAGQRSITSLDPALRAELAAAQQGVSNAEAFANAEGELDYLGFGAQPDNAPRSRGSRRAANDNGLDSFLSSARDRADFGLSEDGDPQSYGLSGRSPLNMQAESIGGLTGSSEGGASASIKQADQVKAAWLDAGGAIADGLGQSFAALITGGKDASKAVLANLGDQMVASGTSHLLQGAFALATANPMGTTMMAIGGAEIAFGMGLGAAMGGGGAAAGGARPSSGMSRSEARDAGPSIINVYALDPTRDAGKSIDKSLRMATRKKMAV